MTFLPCDHEHTHLCEHCLTFLVLSNTTFVLKFIVSIYIISELSLQRLVDEILVSELVYEKKDFYKEVVKDRRQLGKENRNVIFHILI